MTTPLVLLLALSAFLETVLGLVILLAPELAMKNIGITTATPELSYLGVIAGWFCILVAALATQATLWVKKENPAGRMLALILAGFWICIGLQLALQFGKIEHLVLDTAKGALIAFLALKLARKPHPSR